MYVYTFTAYISYVYVIVFILYSFLVVAFFQSMRLWLLLVQ